MQPCNDRGKSRESNLRLSRRVKMQDNGNWFTFVDDSRVSFCKFERLVLIRMTNKFKARNAVVNFGIYFNLSYLRSVLEVVLKTTKSNL